MNYKCPAMPSRFRGFSLIELLVVVMLLALLAGLVVPNLLGKTEKAKSKAAESQIQLLTGLVTEYYVEFGTPPEDLNDLVPQFAKPSQLEDPWGRQYNYEYPGEHSDFDIFTLGADNSPGGEDGDRDVNNWE
ncbi:general secretion pathway protein G [Marinobacter gudaonensis]|uniref:General secretion pathway protein G n=1 Tax=Marinobacter gudaonensis TaxID=375760 RepID=A0A1I6HZU6_9GAMM|nr:type II secretion system protein GspG [Marinobacter gudaonensis]SFR59967.1 general secretion pathway protein G [Marinobacter gudaonensis]